MTDLTSLTATEAAAAMTRGEVTSAALMRVLLDRIAERDPQVQAFVAIDPARALRQAEAADVARAAGRAHGSLHGVPVAIKDIIDTADFPTENGSPIFKGRRPERDAWCVSALRAAGAIVLGKTLTTELATLTPGATRNPVAFGRTPGGSSSGSAAAVAGRMVPIALGTQTGGSVIRPSSFCGIYGFKPTFGSIPRTGVLTQAHSLDTIGIHARSLEDLALVGDVLFGEDAADPVTRDNGRPGLLATATSVWKVQPMVAFARTEAWSEADPVLQEAFGEIVEALGPQVEEAGIDMTLARGLANARIVQNVELAVHYGPLLDRDPAQISQRLAGQIAEGRAVPAHEYVRALQERERIYQAVSEMFVNYGSILTPAAPGPAPEGLGSTGNPVFNSVWTYLGVPCVTLPLLETDGLPMGVQLVGARRDDARLLRTARLLERQLTQTA